MFINYKIKVCNKGTLLGTVDCNELIVILLFDLSQCYFM